jgi:hypothetical protein
MRVIILLTSDAKVREGMGKYAESLAKAVTSP